MHGAGSPRLLGREICTSIVNTIFQLQQDGGRCRIRIDGWWNGETRFARNRVSLSAERKDLRITIDRWIARSGRGGRVVTNQYDTDSLAGATRAAERVSRLFLTTPEPEKFEVDSIVMTRPETKVWSDKTASVTADQRSILALRLSDQSEGEGMLAAGYIEMRAAEWTAADTTESTVEYGMYTQSQCSMTVRHPKGLGSGWAGQSSFDWGAIDSQRIEKVALEKCLASLNPVRIEPGRYTAILEAQAVGDMVKQLVSAMGRYKDPFGAEAGVGPFVLGYDQSLGLIQSKLGLQVIDPRISLTHDVYDPELGVVPSRGLTSALLIDKGVLTSLFFNERLGYSLPWLNSSETLQARSSFRLSGGNTSIDEMIATTKRGLFVTRIAGISVLDRNSVLCTGYTRDGLWLIENGKISKSVHNMRITESPLFFLNQIEQLGVEQPLFNPVADPYATGIRPAIVPSMKVKDFSFTSLIDAV